MGQWGHAHAHMPALSDPQQIIKFSEFIYTQLISLFWICRRNYNKSASTLVPRITALTLAAALARRGWQLSIEICRPRPCCGCTSLLLTDYRSVGQTDIPIPDRYTDAYLLNNNL